MLGMFFLIAFNYNLLRTFKDSMVVTARNSGAEAIPFIKVWAILPGALLLTYLFTRLANRFSREKVFYIMMFLFLGFFFLFTFVLYPLRDTLHPHAFADQMQDLLPSGFKGLIAIFRNWTFTLFYMMCELWGTAHDRCECRLDPVRTSGRVALEPLFHSLASLWGDQMGAIDPLFKLFHYRLRGPHNRSFPLSECPLRQIQTSAPYRA